MTKITKMAVNRFSGIYTRKELSIYFDSLDAILRQTSEQLHHHVDIKLSTLTDDITVTYNPKYKRWSVNGRLISDNKQVGNLIANQIALSVGLIDNLFGNNNAIALGTTVRASADEKSAVSYLIHEWKEQKEFRDLHEITNKKANLKDQFKHTWLDLAVQMGQPFLVEDLLRKMAQYVKNPKIVAAYSSLISISATSGVILLATGIIIPGIILALMGVGWLILLKPSLSTADNHRILNAFEKEKTITWQDEHIIMNYNYEKEVHNYKQLIEFYGVNVQAPTKHPHKQPSETSIVVQKNNAVDTINELESNDQPPVTFETTKMKMK